MLLTWKRPEAVPVSAVISFTQPSLAVAWVNESLYTRRRSGHVCQLGWEEQGGHLSTVLSKHPWPRRALEAVLPALNPSRIRPLLTPHSHPEEKFKSVKRVLKSCERRWKNDQRLLFVPTGLWPVKHACAHRDTLVEGEVSEHQDSLGFNLSPPSKGRNYLIKAFNRV